MSTSLTSIPPHIIVKRLPAKVARGAYKPRIAPRGDAPSFGHAARTTSQIAATADRTALLRYAANPRGYNPR